MPKNGTDMTTTTAVETELATLAGKINAEHGAAEQAIVSALDHARRCGELLIEAKAKCRHGEWKGWVEANVATSYRTAAGYMQIARADVQRVAHLSIRDALSALAEPRAPKDEGHADPLSPDERDRLAVLEARIENAFVPTPGHVLTGRCLALETERETVKDTVIIEESDRPGFYYVTVFNQRSNKDGPDSCEGTVKPIRPEGIHMSIRTCGFPVWDERNTWHLSESTEAPKNFNRWLFDSHEEYMQKHVRGSAERHGTDA